MDKEVLANAISGIIVSLLIIGFAVTCESEVQHEQWLKQGIKKYPDCATARNADVCIKLKTLAEEEE